MNAKRFGDINKILSIDEAIDEMKKEFHTLQDAIFAVVPDGCFIKMWKSLDLRMVFMLSPEMIEKKLVSQKDICSLCSADDCPFNKVDYKYLRVMKVKFIGRFYNQ